MLDRHQHGEGRHDLLALFAGCSNEGRDQRTCRTDEHSDKSTNRTDTEKRPLSWTIDEHGIVPAPAIELPVQRDLKREQRRRQGNLRPPSEGR